MADITATQREALSGMNLSDHEKRMKELEAELEAVKARIAETKANIANLKADKKLIESAQPAKEEIPFAPDRGLTGIRDEDGTLIPIEAEQEVVETEEEAEQEVVETEEESEVSKIDIADIKAIDFEEPVKLKTYVTTREELNALREAEKNNAEIPDRNEAKVQALADKYGIDKIVLIRSPEWQSVYGDKYNDMFLEIPPIIKGATPVAAEEEVEVEGGEVAPEEEPEDDIEGDERTDAESEEMRFGGIDREQGRAESVESEARSEKPGWETKEGSNTWSINEKDDYWKTQDGYDEAVALYGSKPAWVKEPTLVWNPSTQEYEEIEEEEFEDLSRPTISADIKKLFR